MCIERIKQSKCRLLCTKWNNFTQTKSITLSERCWPKNQAMGPSSVADLPVWPSVGQSLGFSSPSVRWQYRYVCSQGDKAVGAEWDRVREGLEEKQRIAIPLKPDVGHKTSHLQSILRNIGVCEPLPSPKTHTPNSKGLVSSFLSILCKYDLLSGLHLTQITSQIKEDGFGSSVRMSRSQWLQSGGSHNQTLNLQLHPSSIMLFVLIPCNHVKSSCELCLSLYKCEWKRPRSHQHPCQQRLPLWCCEDLGCHSCICPGQPLPVAGVHGVLSAVWPSSYGHGQSACTAHPKPLLSRGVLKASTCWFCRQSCNCLKRLLLSQ